MLVVVALNSAVSSLILVNSVGRYQHAGHHSERAERGSDHIAHNVAVVVLARPHITALAADNARYGVVDEGVEECDTRLVKLSLILVFKDLCKNILKAVVVDLADSVLGSKPNVELLVERVVKAAARKGRNTLVKVVHTLDDSVGGKVKDS